MINLSLHSKTPVAEKYYSYSPYNYVLNNPIMLIDPNGMEATPPDNYYIYEDGNIIKEKTNDASDSFYFMDSELGQVPLGTFEKNENGYIQFPNSYTGSFTSDNGEVKEWKLNGVLQENMRWAHPETMAALLGAIYLTGYNDVQIGHISFSDGGCPPPSKTHQFGKSVDLRLLNTSNATGVVTLLEDPEFDLVRNTNLVEALNRYGFKDILSENFNIGGVQYIIPNTRHYNKSRHNNHFHLNRKGFKPTILSTAKFSTRFKKSRIPDPVKSPFPTTFYIKMH